MEIVMFGMFVILLLWLGLIAGFCNKPKLSNGLLITAVVLAIVGLFYLIGGNDMFTQDKMGYKHLII